MKGMPLWAGLVTWVALSASVFAQSTTTAQGFVLDNEGNPIVDAKVLLDYKGHVIQKYHAKTDKKGKFVYVNVYAGSYDVTVSKEGMGEATFKSFAIHDLESTEKLPVFRIGLKRAEAAAPANPTAGTASGPEAGVGPGAPAPTPAEVAGALAADLEKAGAALKAGQLDEAIAGYEAVAVKVPNLPQIQHNLGLAYARKKDMARAEAAFRKAVELKPDFIEAHSALSVVLFEKGNRDEAVSEAAKAVEIAPDNARLQFGLGVMYADTGRMAEAKETLSKAESLDPTNAEVQYQLGTLAVAANQKAEAISRLERYLGMARPEARNVASAKAMIAALKK